MLGLLRRFDRRIVTDGFSDEPAADSVDRTMRKLEDRPPGGLERDGPSRLGEDRIETADSSLGAAPGDPLDETRKTVEPRIERKDPDQLEYAAECRQGQHNIGLVELSTDPASGCRDWREQQDPDDADTHVIDDVRQCGAPHRQPCADRYHGARRCGSDALPHNHRASLFKS